VSETPDSILRLKTVLQRTGLSRSTVYRKMGDGTFPKGLKLSTRCTGWRVSAITEWLRNRQFYDAADHPQD
jgi:prophage regulatory protein